jgi:hypothetical protein
VVASISLAELYLNAPEIAQIWLTSKKAGSNSMVMNRKIAIFFRTLALSFFQALLWIAFDVHTPVGVPYGF